MQNAVSKVQGSIMAMDWDEEEKQFSQHIEVKLPLSVVRTLTSANSVDDKGSVDEIERIIKSVGYTSDTVSHEEESKIEKTSVEVLIIDDSLLIRRVLERFLTSIGCTVRSVENGAEGLQLLHDFTFDLVNLMLN